MIKDNVALTGYQVVVLSIISGVWSMVLNYFIMGFPLWICLISTGVSYLFFLWFITHFNLW